MTYQEMSLTIRRNDSSKLDLEIGVIRPLFSLEESTTSSHLRKPMISDSKLVSFCARSEFDTNHTALTSDELS